MKMDALIRANLGLEPKELDTESFAEAYCQAEWLERFRLRNQAEMIAAMFGGKKKG